MYVITCYFSLIIATQTLSIVIRKLERRYSYSDGEEVLAGTDPKDKNDYPIEVFEFTRTGFLILLPLFICFICIALRKK